MKNAFFQALSAKFSERSRWSYVLTMPAFLAFFCYLLVGVRYFQDWNVFLGATLLNGALLTGTFMAQNRVAELITQRYGGLGQTLPRVLVSLGAHAVLSGTFLLLIAGLYVQFALFGSTVTYRTLIIIYLINMGTIILVMGIQETFHSLSHWRYHEVTMEKLRKENVQGQLQSLKAQVSPHFLFNSLNSLSTLIAEDPEKAEAFVDQMARVYRYLLQTNQTTEDGDSTDELTTLQNELVFIESYYHLLKTRYGEGLHLRLDVDEKYLSHRLPPLTLQLLVENAVKHNVIRASRPLYISIATTPDEFLRVQNNLQKKAVAAGLDKLESTQVGLTNIQTKYQLLQGYYAGLPEPTIENGPEYFTVTLPLIFKVPLDL